MSSARWDRLAASLHAAGHTVQVDHVPFPGGVSHRMTLRVEAGLVEIRDTWWSRNGAAWTGWQAWLEGGDGIVIRGLAHTKVRGHVVQFVTSCAHLAAPVAP